MFPSLREFEATLSCHALRSNGLRSKKRRLHKARAAQRRSTVAGLSKLTRALILLKETSARPLWSSMAFGRTGSGFPFGHAQFHKISTEPEMTQVFRY